MVREVAAVTWDLLYHNHGVKGHDVGGESQW